MTDDNQDRRTDEERKLDRLIRQASESSPLSIEMPSDEAIEAYISGSATDEQEQSILKALEHSDSFRHELLEIMDDLESLGEEVESQGIVAETTEVAGPRQERDPAISTPWDSIKKFLGIGLLVPVAAVAVLLWLNSDREIPSWKLVSDKVDPGRLLSIELQGASEQRELSLYPTSEEATYGAFKEILTLSSSGITVNPEYRIQIPKNQGELSQLVLIDKDESELAHYTAVLFPRPLSSDSSLQAWMLLLPSRQLMRMNMTVDSVLTILPAGSDHKGCLTMTIHSDSGWSFTPPASFGFNGRNPNEKPD